MLKSKIKKILCYSICFKIIKKTPLNLASTSGKIEMKELLEQAEYKDVNFFVDWDWDH